MTKPAMPSDEVLSGDMVERYEAEAATFCKETGVMAPGKDAPAAMGGYDADELRHKLWRVWARAVYAERERDELRERLAAVEREAQDALETQTRTIDHLSSDAARAERILAALR